MSSIEKLSCKNEISNELIDNNPLVVEYVVAEMRAEIGKAIADKLCDGREYRMSMSEVRQDSAFHTNRTGFRIDVNVAPIISCGECKYFDGTWCACHGNIFATDDFCSCGERSSE